MRQVDRNGGGLGQALIEAGYASEAEVRKALDLQSSFGGRLGTNLLEIGAVSEGELLAVLGRVRRTQTVDAEALRRIPQEVLRMVPPKLARRFEIVPFKRSAGSLLVAGLDPGDAVVEDELATITGSLVRTVIGLEIRVRAALERFYRIPQSVRLTALSRRIDSQSGAIPRPDLRPEVSEDALPATPAEPMPAVETPAGEAKVERRRPRKVERAKPVHEIELTKDDRDRIFGKTDAVELPSAAPTDPDERLQAASGVLARAEMRDDVADAMIAFCAVDFRRVILFIRRGEQILGWRGHGDGLDRRIVRAIEIDAGAPSLLANVRASRKVWMGPLPPFPSQTALVDALGGAPPACVVAPVEVREKLVAFLYADNADRGFESAPVTHLERLARMAGLALEVALLRNKIRTL